MLAINLVDKNEYLIKLKEQAESIGQSKPDEVYPFVRSIIRSINLNVKSEESWKIFETQFKAIHRGFMEYIASHYFELTVTELKVCALLKINLSSKEISTLLNLSTRTVEDHRLNIRKKLGLDKDVILNQFIATLQYIS
jgi:DNA-binding CsgD family transcriptional regulator